MNGWRKLSPEEFATAYWEERQKLVLKRQIKKLYEQSPPPRPERKLPRWVWLCIGIVCLNYALLAACAAFRLYEMVAR